MIPEPVTDPEVPAIRLQGTDRKHRRIPKSIHADRRVPREYRGAETSEKARHRLDARNSKGA